MSNGDSLRQLRQLFLADTPEAIDIDDELLAEIATAVAAGEDVDARYAVELRQIEASVPLAEAYAELVDMMTTAVSQMAAAAAAVSPQDVYVRLLQQQLDAPADLQATLVPILRTISTHLAQHTQAEPPADIPLSTDVLEQVAGALSPTWRTRLQDAIRRQRTALALYLRGQADLLWERTIKVVATGTQNQPVLQLTLAPETVPVLSGADTGDSRTLFNRRIGHPLPQNVAVEVERIDALTCRLTVQRLRLGQTDAAGQQIVVQYGETRPVTETAVTDSTGTATFPPISIAALPTLQIELTQASHHE